MPWRPSRSDRSAAWISADSAGPVEQELRRDLDEANAEFRQIARADPQIGDMIHREAITERNQRGEALLFDRPHIAERVLREFQRQRRTERAIGFQEIVKLPEDVGDRSGSQSIRCRTGRFRDFSAAAGATPARSGTAACGRCRRSARTSRHGRENRSAGSACRPRCEAASSLRSSAPCAAAASPPAADRDRSACCRCAPAMVAVISSAVFPFSGPVATNSRSGAGSGVTAATGSMRATGSGSTRTGGCRRGASASATSAGRRKFSLQPPDFTEPGVMIATVSASCFTSVPSSPISAASASFGARERLAPSCASMAFNPAADFADLTGEIGGAARQIGDLFADIVAIAQTAPTRYCRAQALS